jgi:phosphoethanolamine N-methyltransferase
VISNKKEATREDFRSYWTDEHGAPTLENMMLDSNAATMDVLERPEILAELPSLNSKTILELGAGIGRFSSALAEKAEKVISVDFVEASCKINRDTNSKYTNLEVVCEDALKLSFAPNSFDIVFSNWLLMYLSDEEVQTLANNCLTWLKPGGRIFFRESCFHRSGNAPRRWNPTIYRDPRTYFKFFNAARGTADGGSRFQLCKTSCVHAYVRMKNNPNQVWWIWEKCTSGHLIRYLDTQQYDYNSVFRYEQLYGPGFISTGGKALIEDISSKLTGSGKPLAGARVLDVGCGLGGNMVHFASLGCFVHGIDISGIMVSIASERYLKMPAEIQQRISISVGDVFDSNFIPNSFDVICCRDFLMHFSESDKQILLTKFSRWLAPGGSVIISDYTALKPQSELSPNFAAYIEERNYHLLERSQFESMLTTLGFQFVATDQIVAGKSFGVYLDHQLDEYGKLVEAKKCASKDSVSRINQGKIFDAVFTAIKNVEPSDDELALVIAQTSADLTTKFIQDKEESIKEEEANFEWVKKYWGLKIKSAANEELGYCVYIASRSN